MTVPAETFATPQPSTSASRALLQTLQHRIDAWGVAFVIGLVVLYLHDAEHVSDLLIPAAISILYVLGYLVNDYFDRVTDASDPLKHANNMFVRHQPRVALLRLCLAALVVAPLAVFAAHGWLGLLLFCLCLLALWAYSAPPLRLKSRPGLDLLAHGLFVQTFVYFMCMVLIDAHWTQLDVLILGAMFLASVSGQLAQQLRDLDADRAAGELTFCIWAGPSIGQWALRCVTLALALLIVGGIASGVVPLHLAPFGLAFAPATLGRLLHPDEPYRHSFRRTASIGAILYALAIFAIGLHN